MFAFFGMGEEDGCGEQAQNQLGVPLVESLDVLASIGLQRMLVFGLVSLGNKWQLYVGYA